MILPNYKNYYFTFGCAHPLSNYVQKISASCQRAARETMGNFYGDKWGFVYSDADAVEDGEGNVIIMGSYKYKLLPTPLAEGDDLI